MARAAIFIADGTEETEAITTIDLLRRAKIDVDIISVMPTSEITASRGLRIIADDVLGTFGVDDYDMLILPGGVKGTENLNNTEYLKEQFTAYNNAGKGLAAICAAPTILGNWGLLGGKKATCNPGFWEKLKETGAELDEDSKVVVDGNIITSQAMGTSVDFGLAIVGYLLGAEEAAKLKANIRF